MDRDDRREIALFGIDPNAEYLISEILRTHEVPYLALSSTDEARIWIEAGPKRAPLLIVEADPEGRIPPEVRALRSRSPLLRVLALPSDFKPSELLSLIESALLARPAARIGGQAKDPPFRFPRFTG
jgi:hypothetical protein